jgi:hypothetical protein
MAVPAQLFQAASVKGNREDLIDKIFQVSPTETPITSAAGKVTATSVFHEWQVDSLAAPVSTNAAIDGDDATLQSQTATQRLGNHCQILTKVIGVSRRANLIKKAGRGMELGYLKAKAMTELKRDIEKTAVSLNPAVAATTSVAGKMGGLAVQCVTNTSHGSGGSTAAWTAGAPTTAPTSGTGRALTAAQVSTVQQSIFTNSGTQPGEIFLSPAHKVVFSAFTGIATNRLDLNKKTQQGAIIVGADVYMGDFGAINIVPHYMMAGSTDAFILNTDYIDVAFLDGIKESALAKTGDSERILITADCTLAVRSPAAQGKISDLTGG